MEPNGIWFHTRQIANSFVYTEILNSGSLGILLRCCNKYKQLYAIVLLMTGALFCSALMYNPVNVIIMSACGQWAVFIEPMALWFCHFTSQSHSVKSQHPCQDRGPEAAQSGASHQLPAAIRPPQRKSSPFAGETDPMSRSVSVEQGSAEGHFKPHLRPPKL